MGISEGEETREGPSWMTRSEREAEEREKENRGTRGQALLFNGAETLLLLVVTVLVTFCIARVLGLDLPEEPGEISDLLFGGASIALILVSFMVGFLGIFGARWFRDEIARQVGAEAARIEEACERELLRLEKAQKLDLEQQEIEIEALHHSGLGFTWMMLSHSFKKLEPTDPQGIEHAIHYLKRSLEGFERLECPSEEIEDKRRSAENNLAFSCAVDGSEKHAKLALELAKRLRERADAENFELLTWARVVLHFDSQGEDSKRARKLLRDWIERDALTREEKEEASLYLKDFPYRDATN